MQQFSDKLLKNDPRLFVTIRKFYGYYMLKIWLLHNHCYVHSSQKMKTNRKLLLGLKPHHVGSLEYVG